MSNGTTPQAGRRKKGRRCDQCALLRINGIVCHEIGCPSARKVKVCAGCYGRFKPRNNRENANQRFCRRCRF